MTLTWHDLCATVDGFTKPPLRAENREFTMAVTIVKVFQGINIAINDVIATADADVAATIPHGLGAAPFEVYLTPLLSQALAALSAWAVATPPATGITSVNLVLTKLATAGSGNAVAQLRTVCKSPAGLGL